MDFLLHRSRVANSRYGQLAENTVAAYRSNVHQREQIKEKETRGVFPRAFPMLLNREVKQDCRLCKQAHHFECCPKFLELKTTERWAIARRLGVCFNCLNSSHMSADCRIGIPSREFRCILRHHALLHRTDSKINVYAETRVTKNANICIATHSKAVRLCIIPVKVETPAGLVETLAFLDTGSDTTSVKQQFMKDNNIINKTTASTMTTLEGTTTTQGFTGFLKLYSLDERNSVVVDEVYSVKEIPVRPTRSVTYEAKKLPHTQVIRFDKLPSSKVTVLIGCDVPEAHWALEQRVNMTIQPYAIKTLIGWVMCGPLNKKEMANTCIANTDSANDSIDDCLEKLYNNEFSNTSDRTPTRSREDCYALEFVKTYLIFVSDLKSAKLILLKAVQEENYGDDMLELTNNKNIKKDSKLRQLNPLMLGGLIRACSRRSITDVPEDTKFPIILPAKHPVTTFIIRHYHEMQGHRGYAQVLFSIRQGCWITHGAAAIKRVLIIFFTCRKHNATPGQQIMEPLPTFRTKPGWLPLMHVDIDYFSAIATKHSRSSEKRYGCLITCVQTRAFHIEVASSLSTDSFLIALLRFVARRETPTDIYSDKGSNVVGAHKELMQWMDRVDQNARDRQLSLRDIQWHFNPTYGRVRTVAVKTQTGEFIRNVRHICLLKGKRINERVNDRGVVP